MEVVIMIKHLETERLILWIPYIKDLNNIHKYSTDKDILKYLAWKVHENIEETKDFILTRINEWNLNQRFSWTIELKETNKAIGMISFKKQYYFWISISYYNFKIEYALWPILL